MPEGDSDAPMPERGRLRPPYPVEHCANAKCVKPLTDADAAYLFSNLNEGGGLCVFCEDCAAYVELNARTSFALVAL